MPSSTDTGTDRQEISDDQVQVTPQVPVGLEDWAAAYAAWLNAFGDPVGAAHAAENADADADADADAAAADALENCGDCGHPHDPLAGYCPRCNIQCGMCGEPKGDGTECACTRVCPHCRKNKQFGGCRCEGKTRLRHERPLSPEEPFPEEPFPDEDAERCCRCGRLTSFQNAHYHYCDQCSGGSV